jgi:tRNA (mo5U34)-methyltransferase
MAPDRTAGTKLNIAAGDRGFDSRVRQLSDSVQSRFRYHTIELPDGGVLPGLQTVEHLRWRLSLFGLPGDLCGKRVLDIGAWDGWFSFECERRGAEVVAVDCVALNTFLEARELLGSRVEYLTVDVGELSANKLGRFDVVLFFGVLYHLRHPLLGLEKVVELCSDLALIESFVIPSENRTIPAVLEFYERTELGGQIDNWCGPSPEGLLAMCRSAGFAQADLKDVTNQRASVACRRRWPEPENTGAAPHLNAVINNRTQIARFHPLKDEYLCCYFRTPEGELTADTIFVEVDGFGTQSLVVTANGKGAWQADCMRPPGLAPGRHRVRLRTRRSPLSNTVEFEMSDESGNSAAVPSESLPADPPELCSAEFQPPGDRRIAIGRAGSLVCYFRSGAEMLGAIDVRVDVNGEIRQVATIGSLGEGVWQANLLLDEDPPAEATIRVRLGNGPWSAPLGGTRGAGSG